MLLLALVGCSEPRAGVQYEQVRWCGYFDVDGGHHVGDVYLCAEINKAKEKTRELCPDAGRELRVAASHWAVRARGGWRSKSGRA